MAMAFDPNRWTLRTQEAVSGVCAACIGAGWLLGGPPRTCWRCQGSGLPPAAGAFAIVDAEARRSVGFARRAGDRLLQYLLDCRGQTVRSRARCSGRRGNRRRAAPRGQAGDVQCLADVDVSQSGHHTLIEQGDLQRRLPACTPPRQRVAVELV